MAWALIFAVAKRTGIEDRVIRAGGWQTGFPVPLAGKTLGLLGAAASAARWSRSPRRSAWTSSRGARTSPRSAAPSSASTGHQGRAPGVGRRPRGLPRLLRALPQHAAGGRPGQDEAGRHPGEHLPRPDRRGGGTHRGAPLRPRWPAPASTSSTASRSPPTTRSGRWTTSSSPRTSATSPSTASAPPGSAWPRTSRPTSRDRRSASSPTRPTARRWHRNSARPRLEVGQAGGVPA